jgi:4-hydroxybenzoyl-CoA thioesterase
MARIVINLPEKFIFSTNIPVRIGDTNSAGHVSWASMFLILDEAYVQFWNTLNSPEKAGERMSRITVDAGINYKKQAYHGQTLKIEVGTADMSSKGFDVVFKVTDAANGAEVARAKQGVLCYDYRDQKVVSIPDELRKKAHSVRLLR